MENTEGQSPFYIVANNLALDFVNTVTDDLNVTTLVAWAVAVGLLDAEGAGETVANWQGKSLAAVKRTRDRLREVVVGLVATRDLADGDIAWLNKALRGRSGYSELVRTAEGFAKQNRVVLGEPSDILVPVIESFVDLVAYGTIEHIRKCERPECMIYFHDITKNHKRRWCSMAVCGNRAKVAKFYERQRSKTKSG